MKTEKREVHQQALKLAEQIILLEREIAPHREALRQQEELKRLLRDCIDRAYEPIEQVVIQSGGDQVTVSKAREERVLTDRKRLVRLLGRAKFDTLAHFNMTDLHDTLSKEQLEQVTSVIYGNRSVTKVSLGV